MSEEQVPVLIVGAGAAGLSLSLLLLQQGIHPLLIERRADISIYPRARAPISAASPPGHGVEGRLPGRRCLLVAGPDATGSPAVAVPRQERRHRVRPGRHRNAAAAKPISRLVVRPYPYWAQIGMALIAS